MSFDHSNGLSHGRINLGYGVNDRGIFRLKKSSSISRISGTMVGIFFFCTFSPFSLNNVSI